MQRCLALTASCQPFLFITLFNAHQDIGQDVEPYFQEVVAAVEQSAEEVSTEGTRHTARLQQLHDKILAAARRDAARSHDPGPSAGTWSDFLPA